MKNDYEIFEQIRRDSKKKWFLKLILALLLVVILLLLAIYLYLDGLKKHSDGCVGLAIIVILLAPFLPSGSPELKVAKKLLKEKKLTDWETFHIAMGNVK